VLICQLFRIPAQLEKRMNRRCQDCIANSEPGDELRKLSNLCWNPEMMAINNGRAVSEVVLAGG